MRRPPFKRGRDRGIATQRLADLLQCPAGRHYAVGDDACGRQGLHPGTAWAVLALLSLHARAGVRLAWRAAPGGEWNLRTGSGSITIDFPDDAAFELDARAGSGGVRRDHPLTVTGTARHGRLEGTVRGGGPTVTLRTGSGGITIN